MERFIDPCCDQCTHSRATPCEQFVECCLEGPMCHESEPCRQAHQTIVATYAHSPAFREQ